MSKIASFYYKTDNGDRAMVYVEAKVEILEHVPDEEWTSEIFTNACLDQVSQLFEVASLATSEAAGEA